MGKNKKQEFTIFHAMGMFVDELKNNANFYAAFEDSIYISIISEYNKITRGVNIIDHTFLTELSKRSAKRFLSDICNPPIPQINKP